MDVSTLQKKLAAGEAIILIDVRDADEVAREPYFVTPPKNYLNIAVLPLLFAAKEELEHKIFQGAEFDPATPIVTLCHSGGRSARACETLREHGWQAESLDGGILAWGKPL